MFQVHVSLSCAIFGMCWTLSVGTTPTLTSHSSTVHIEQITQQSLHIFLYLTW